MRILAISDKESKYLWDYFEKEKLEGIDLIISCGDLDSRYLSFLATFTTVPVLYVHGNHDDDYDKIPPDGCICIEDKIYVHNGVRIMGLGGSMRYKPGKHQFTEREMALRRHKMWFQLRRKGGVDILVTHAPAKGIHDGDDLTHQGFRTFRKLLDDYKPRFMLHGHMHLNYGRASGGRYSEYNGVHVINAYERCVFDYEDENLRENIR